MRKKIFFVMLTLILFFCMIHKNTYENNENKTKFSKLKINQNDKIVNANRYIEIQGSFVFDSSIKEQYKNSDLVISGKILNVEYLVCDNIPWSKIEIQCKDVFKGRIAKDSSILVYVLGGYLEKKSYEKKFGSLDGNISNDTLIELDYFQNDLSNPGDEGIFYLVSNNANSIFEENTYSFVCSGYSKMMYDENGDNIIYKNDTGVKVISKKDYFAKLNKIIKQ